MRFPVTRKQPASSARRPRIQELEARVEELSAEIERQKSRYTLLTDNLAASIIVRNAAGHITYCNPYTEVLTGFPISELTAGEDFWQRILHPQDRTVFDRAKKFIESGEPFQYRYRIFHRTGIEIWAETRTVPVQLDSDMEISGNNFSSLSVTLDITSTVLNQRQVEERNRDLEEFTYMISHDLKAPIYTIKGMARVLQEDFAEKLGPDGVEPLGHITQSAERLEGLVASVLQYARITRQNNAVAPVALAAVLQNVVSDLQLQIKECGATVNLNGEFPDVIGEQLKLYQIFSNLLTNSLKYRSTEAPRISISTADGLTQRECVITFEDNGIGIDAERLPTIFRPFQRGRHSNVDGMGIGLACVKRSLEKINGEIAVSSQPGKGSVFRLTLRKALAAVGQR